MGSPVGAGGVAPSGPEAAHRGPWSAISASRPNTALRGSHSPVPGAEAVGPGAGVSAFDEPLRFALERALAGLLGRTSVGQESRRLTAGSVRL
jgi:hypothetical protein